ncbi:MAG: response regulator transcription factor [Chloroflexota bacterium]
MTTVLLVEDTIDLARLIERELTGEGYRVVRAADGLAALDLHGREHPDVVVLDWMLPKLNGLEVLRRLRQSSPVPVLMLTARGEEADRVLGLEVGADDYLTKPFSMRELMARIRALLRRDERLRELLLADREGDEAPLDHGALHVDPAARLATLAGRPLDLSKTEFDLLCLFLHNPGRAFSRDYLLDAVWGENYVAGDRSVDNAIGRLRKHLGSLGEQIETVWGIGYRLRQEP